MAEFYQIVRDIYVQKMPSVDIEQNSAPRAVAGLFPYEVDSCLPQRVAIDSGKVGFQAWSHGHYPGKRIQPKWLSGVPSMGYFDVIGTQDWGIPAHRNEGIEICYQQTGESVLKVDGTSHRMLPNSLSLTRPWQLHSLGDPYLRSGRLIWVIIDVGVIRPNQDWTLPDWCVLTSSDRTELVDKLRGNEHPVWKATPRISECFSKITQLVEAPSVDPAISQARVQLNALLLGVLDMLSEQNVSTDDTLTTRRRAVQLFLGELERDGRLLAQPWTLEQMAGQCGVKRTTFSHYCHEMTNSSPIEALNRWRLTRAAEQLHAEPDKSITSIALEAGYSSSQYFATKFKRQHGMSPRQWRVQGRAAEILCAVE